MNLVCIGNITYWKNILSDKASIISFYTHHTFQKQSSLSQFQIMSTNGVLKLSIPTKKSTRKGLYEDVEIDYNSNWQIEHWRSIQNAYQKSPFFLYYGYKIEKVFMSHHTHLIDLNNALLQEIIKCIKIDRHVDLNNKTKIYFEETNLKDHPIYPQVFDTKHPFVSNLSVLDLLFNLGPETLEYLVNF